MQRLRASIAALVTASAMAGFGMNCQGTDARVFAVTPTDHLLPADFVFVQGRNFGGTMTAELLDPADPVAVLPTPVVIDVQPNSLRVSIPSFSTARRPYTLRIRKNGQLAPSQTTASSQIYLRSFGSTPPAQDIRIQHIAWGELQIFLFAENAWFHFPPPYTNSGNDEWTGDWIVLKPLHDQASRDWATICGAAWYLGATRIVRGIAEDVPRESLTWNFYTRMDVTVGNPFLQALAAGQMLWDPADRSSLTGHLAGRTFGPCATETDPVACAKFVGERPNTVVIHHVTKMFQDGLEVNPATDFRALEPPRDCRRLHSLGGWSDGSAKQVLGRGARAGGPDGVGASGPVRVAMGGDPLDLGEARLLVGSPAQVGSTGGDRRGEAAGRHER